MTDGQLSNAQRIPQLRMTKLRRKVLRAMARANTGKARRPIFKKSGGMFGDSSRARSSRFARWVKAEPWNPVAYEFIYDKVRTYGNQKRVWVSTDRGRQADAVIDR